MSWLQKSGDGLVLSIKVVPRASRDEVQGILGDKLKIRIQAPPVDSKANEALVEFLAKTLGLPRRSVTLLSGATSRSKRLLVKGIGEAELRRGLGV